MGTHQLSLSVCIGEFYMVGKVDIENVRIIKNRKNREFNISLTVCEEDIKRLDDPEFTNTEAEARSNIIQINFETGEKKWI